MIEKIVEMLKNNFCCVYCNSCAHDNTDDEVCEWCHRKYMNWTISDAEARMVAEKIFDLVNQSTIDEITE